MRCERVLIAILVLGYCLGVHENSQAQQRSDARVADLVQAGKLRAGVGVVAPHWAVKDQTTGELRGVAVEIARALAGAIRVPLVLVEYPSPPKVLDGVKDNAWDVGFLAIDPSRATVVDFSPPYLEIDATYLVPESSAIHTVADAVKRGTHVAVKITASYRADYVYRTSATLECSSSTTAPRTATFGAELPGDRDPDWSGVAPERTCRSEQTKRRGRVESGP